MDRGETLAQAVVRVREAGGAFSAAEVYAVLQGEDAWATASLPQVRRAITAANALLDDAAKAERKAAKAGERAKAEAERSAAAARSLNPQAPRRGACCRRASSKQSIHGSQSGAARAFALDDSRQGDAISGAPRETAQRRRVVLQLARHHLVVRHVPRQGSQQMHEAILRIAGARTPLQRLEMPDVQLCHLHGVLREGGEGALLP